MHYKNSIVSLSYRQTTLTRIFLLLSLVISSTSCPSSPHPLTRCLLALSPVISLPCHPSSPCPVTRHLLAPSPVISLLPHPSSPCSLIRHLLALSLVISLLSHSSSPRKKQVVAFLIDGSVVKYLCCNLVRMKRKCNFAVAKCQQFAVFANKM